MTKTQEAMQKIAKPHQEILTRFIAQGGTITEFAIAHPFDNGVLYALNMLALTQ